MPPSVLERVLVADCRIFQASIPGKPSAAPRLLVDCPDVGHLRALAGMRALRGLQPGARMAQGWQRGIAPSDGLNVKIIAD